MNKWAELVLGLILVIGAILIAFFSVPWDIAGVSFNFWTPAWNFLKGGIFWFVIMIGVLFILLGISDLKG
jgi:site-specific recombinase